MFVLWPRVKRKKEGSKMMRTMKVLACVVVMVLSVTVLHSTATSAPIELTGKDFAKSVSSGVWLVELYVF